MEEPNTKLLIVDDDVELLNLLGDYFTRHQFDVDIAETVYQARTLLREKRFDIIVLDLQLGRGDNGSDLCQQIRKLSDVPILMLTSTEDDDEKISCFRAGIDDYVTKPCRNDVLLAHIQAILNRIESKKTVAATYHFLNWSFEPQSAILTDPKGKKVHLTDNIAALLMTFLKHPQETLTREQLIKMTQGRSFYDPFERTIDIQLCRLRQKFKQNQKSLPLIRTVRGHGYSFVPKVKKSLSSETF
ncbi:MAG: response regulator transcription factor [Pseudomonadota bacterium]